MKIHNVTVPAGGFVEVVQVGDFVRILEAADQVTVQTDQGLYAEMQKGQAVRQPERFDRVRISNATGADLALDVAIGFGEFWDDRMIGEVLTNQISPSTLNTPADVSFSVAQVLIAANTSRKAVVIAAAPGNTANVKIGDSNVGAARGVTLQPGQSITIQSTAAIYGYAATSQTAEILEV